MIIRRHKLVVGHGISRVTICQSTDVHLGSDGHHKKLFSKFLFRVAKDPNARWIDTGDFLDCDRPSTRERKNYRYMDRDEEKKRDDDKEMNWIDANVIPRLKPIAHKCLGMLDGDHYQVFYNGETSTQYICRRLSMPYLGERMAYVGVIFEHANGKASSCSYTILARHGRGGAGTNGGDINALEKQNAGFIADLYLGGHTHKENVHPVPMLHPDRFFSRLKQKVVWYVRGGSFLRGYLTGHKLYPERAEYPPLATGWAEIELTLSRPQYNNRNLCITGSSGKLVAA